MRIPTAVLAAMLLAATMIVPSDSSAASRGVQVRLKASESAGAPDAGTVTLYGASHALVIGIDKYTGGWPRLSKAVEDAEAVARELANRGFQVTLKRNLGASQLKEALEEFFAVKGDNPEARLFVWFAGHGYSEDGEGYLIPADAPAPKTGAPFRLKALSLRRFGEYARLARSKHAFAVFDACFAGTVFKVQRERPPPAVTRATTKPVRQFLSSGDAGQSVSDDGRFRTLFLRALGGEENADANGDGYLTASELGMHLSDRLTNLTDERQTPKYGKLQDENWDQGDFVFVLPGAEGGGRAAPQAEVVFWQSIQNSANPAMFEAYLSQYPNGPFAALARVKIEELKTSQVAALAPQPTAPSEEQVREAQRLLTALGYDTRGVDGIAGSATLEAVQRFRAAYRVSGNGIDLNLLKGLRNVFRALQTATARNESLAGQRTSAIQELRFSYEFRSGRYVRKISGTVEDARGLWNALAALKPPPGARGDYGLIGDDHLLGKENGYGLRQLGLVARRYLTVENLYVEQPAGFGGIGVQSGTFTRIGELNDTTLGWVLFDLRGKLEGDLKKLVN